MPVTSGVSREQLDASIMIRAAICIAIVLSSSSARLNAQSNSAEVRNPIIDSLAASLVPEQVPGLAVLAMKNGRVIHRATYGVSSIASANPVKLHTPFYIASTAKMFTAAAVLSLIDAGRLRFDEAIGRHLPMVPEYARELTVEQLLTHTSGLPDHYDLGGEERTYTNSDVIEILGRADSLKFEPGSRPAYSNSGYVLLALLVEAVSGESFADFLKHRFFEPFGLQDAVVADRNAALPAVRAVGYRSAGGGFEAHDYQSSTTGAGGVYASLSDLERWYYALRTGQVLKPTTLQLASRPPTLASGKLTPYGMGWLAEFAARGPLKDKWYVFAFGSLRGFRAAFQWYQEDDVLLVWLANGSSDAVIDAMHGVPELLMTDERLRYTGPQSSLPTAPLLRFQRIQP